MPQVDHVGKENYFFSWLELIENTTQLFISKLCYPVTAHLSLHIIPKEIHSAAEYFLIKKPGPTTFQEPHIKFKNKSKTMTDKSTICLETFKNVFFEKG